MSKPQKYYEIAYKCNNCTCTTRIIRSNYQKVTPFVCPCGSIDTTKSETEIDWNSTRRN